MEQIVSNNVLLAKYMGAKWNEGIPGYWMFSIHPAAPQVTKNRWAASIDELFFNSRWEWLMPVAKKAYDELNALESTAAQRTASDLREGIRKALSMFNIKEVWLCTVMAVEFIEEVKEAAMNHIQQLIPGGIS